MNECRWIETRLEDVLSDHPESRRRVRQHVAGCAFCREELAGHEQVDRLVLAHFQERSRRASRAAASAPAFFRLAAVAGAGMLAALALWTGLSQPATPDPAGGGLSQPNSRTEAPEDPLRAKPSLPEAGGTAPPIAERIPAPGFHVSDAAGYFYTLDDFRGSILLLAVFDETGRGAAQFHQIYEAYRARPGLRLAAVATGDPGGARMAFPILTNAGSSLLNTAPGEFVLLTSDGQVHRRGSLEDARLSETIASALRALGVP